jgi:TonB family protein
MKRFLAAAAILLACAPASRLAAQDTSRVAKFTRGMVTAMREPDGTTLVFDTLLLTRLRPKVFSVHTITVFPAATAAEHDTLADSEFDLEELDCARGMSRTWSAALFAGDSLVRRVEIGGPPQPVSEARLPVFQALCQALEPFDRPAYDESRVVKPPALLNSSAVAAALAREYPPALRDANVTGSVMLQIGIDEDGHVDTASVRIQEATDPRFAAAALRVVSIMRFRPEVLRGMRIGTSVVMPVIFDLQPPPLPTGSPAADLPRP